MSDKLNELAKQSKIVVK